MIYKFTNTSNIIIRIDDELYSSIPADEANTDYQAYLAWVALGNTAEEWTGE
jgi:hypothetical protein